MEIKVGVQHVGRELTIECDATAAEVEEQIRRELSTGGGLLRLTDTKGRTLLVPADRIGYVDLGQEHARPVGFGSV